MATEPTPVSSRDELLRQFQTAFDEYYLDLQKASLDATQRFQKMQMEFEQSAEQASRTREPAAVQAEVDNYRRAYTNACNELSPASVCSDTYKKYVAATQRAMSGASAKDLDPLMLNQLGQAFLLIANSAQSLTCGLPETEDKAA